MNAILTDYNYDSKKIQLKEKKHYTKNFLKTDTDNLNTKQSDKYIPVINCVYTNIKYSTMYNYNDSMLDNLCILTNYIQLLSHGTKFKDKFNTSVYFCIPNDKSNFSEMIISICNDICNEITKITKSSPTFRLPYTENNFVVFLKSIYKSDKHNYNKCKIHFHESKKNGGSVISLVNDKIDMTSNKITKLMPMFKSRYYLNNNDKDKDIHYVGKFVLFFEVVLSTYSIDSSEPIESDHINNMICDIKLVATEMEIKYNVSHCKSVLSSDVIEFPIKTHNIHSVEI